MSEEHPAGTVPAAHHTLAILTYLNQTGTPVAASRIATDLNIPRSTTYQLLATLAHHHYVTHLPDQRRYALGPAARTLAATNTLSHHLTRYGRPLCQELSDKLTQPVNLAILEHKDIRYLVTNRPTNQPPILTDPHVKLPAELTATGRAILAHLSPAQLRALYPHNDHLRTRHQTDPTTLKALRAELLATRTRGYGVEHDEITPGYSSIAHHIVDHTGDPVAALAITYAQNSNPNLDRLLAELRAATTRISQLLGARLS